ncbi:olfactory receptor 5B12-like [Apodemus sylvaticus]|uniref:olfactory receptor 5B12-like n=1 Tax=Apodemus sylvaticus TaxID=10129 RepID=UPI0022424057|nr:olfactory receptor 5B12-like [Apodemus sylvaticus]
MENSTEVTEFILAGLTDDPELQIVLLLVFLLIYLGTVLGNLGMVGLILLDSHLQTPMYLFLIHLSLVDFGYSSAVTPKVMAGLLSIDKTISHNACGTQLFFFVSFITTESFLLAAMAYDRYAAVCKPLHYPTTMTTNTCACLTIGSYVCGFLNSSIHTGNIFRLSFCKSNVIDHFFCDVLPLLALSCSDTSVSEMVILFLVGFNVFFSIVIIMVSYLFIFITILRMHSSEGRQKAFSTCASHLTAVSIFYGSGIFMYLQPSSSHTMGSDKMASVFYTMIIPMLNPLVYSLRNKEVTSAFKKAVEKAKISLAFTF